MPLQNVTVFMFFFTSSSATIPHLRHKMNLSPYFSLNCNFPPKNDATKAKTNNSTTKILLNNISNKAKDNEIMTVLVHQLLWQVQLIQCPHWPNLQGELQRHCDTKQQCFGVQPIEGYLCLHHARWPPFPHAHRKRNLRVLCQILTTTLALSPRRRHTSRPSSMPTIPRRMIGGFLLIPIFMASVSIWWDLKIG